MSRDFSVESQLTCPNCKALNSPGTIVCGGCGVNLPAYYAARERLHDLQAEQAASHTRQLEEAGADYLAAEVARGRQQLIRLVQGTLVIAAALTALIVTVLVFRAYQKHLQRERLAGEYEQALTCLEQGEYICARDGFKAILRTDKDYRDAQMLLNQARYQLAQNYASTERWELALDELGAFLADSPDDPRALELLDDVYEGWLQQAQAQRNIMLMVRIWTRWVTRNP